MTIEVPPTYRSSPLHAVTVSAVEQALQHRQPLNVRVDEIVVTGEGEPVCILLIPHRQLGGVALIVWSGARGVELGWGQVTTLRRHDDIDLAVRVSGPIAAGNADGIVGGISAEMARPIRVRLRARRVRKPRVECSIEIDGKTAVVGRLSLGSRTPFSESLTTTLVEGSLPFDVPVPLGEWRRSA